MLLEIAYICLNIFIGSRMRALGNIMHECVHNIFVSKRSLNYFIGSFIAIFLFECFDQYKSAHLKHHRYLGNDVYDSDYVKYKKIKLNLFSNNCWNVLCSIFNPIQWCDGLKAIFSLSAQKTIVKIIKFFYLLLVLLLLYFWPREILLYYLIPYVTSYQIFKLFSDIVDHDYLYEKDSLDDRSRNHIFRSSLLNFLFFPRNDAYHLVHHLYPRLRTAEYPMRHEELMKKNFQYSQKNHSCDLQKFSHSGIQC